MNQVTTQNNQSISPQQQGYNNIYAALKDPKTTNRIAMSLGIDPTDQQAKAEVAPYASSVLMEIERNFGDKNKDLSTCDPNSIVQCVVDAARMKLTIDNRQHAHLVKFGNKATLQIGYRGYIHKIKEHFPDADFSHGAIYEGDVFTLSSENGFDDYKLEKADPFEDNEDKLKGVYVVISYTLGGVPRQKVTTLSKSMINKIKKVAKTKFVWDAWLVEKAIAAGIKRACKVHFASIKELKEVVDYDNKNNFKDLKEVKSDNPFETMNEIAQVEQKDDFVNQIEQTKNVEDQNNDNLIDKEPKDIDPPSDLFEEHSTFDIKKALFDSLESINDQESYTAFFLEFEEDIVTLDQSDQETIANKIKAIKNKLNI